MRFSWVTNDPDAAKRLRAAERTYQLALAATCNMCLADKVAAIKAARLAKEAAYAAALEDNA